MGKKTEAAALLIPESKVGTTPIVEANERKGVGRQTDRHREIETETGSVTQTAQEIETGIVAATETESAHTNVEAQQDI